MAITQLSALLENVPGTMYGAVNLITDAGVNIRALSVADTRDFGILRVIVSDVEKAKAALSSDIVVTETPVIAVEMSDEAGALRNVLAALQDQGINIEYIYAFTGAVQGSAYVVMRVNDTDAAEKVLNRKGIQTLSDADLEGFLA